MGLYFLRKDERNGFSHYLISVEMNRNIEVIPSIRFRCSLVDIVTKATAKVKIIVVVCSLSCFR